MLKRDKKINRQSVNLGYIGILHLLIIAASLDQTKSTLDLLIWTIGS